MCDSVTIIPQTAYRYRLYAHKLIIKDRIVTRYFIVIVDTATGLKVAWTDFHKYIRGSRKSNLQSIQANQRKHFVYVTKLLNYVYFEKYHIARLTELTIVMIDDYLNAYAQIRLPGDDETTTRTEETVKRCQEAIIEFIITLLRQGVKLGFVESDLYRTETIYSPKRHRNVERKVPVFVVKYIGAKATTIYRDIPEKAFRVIFDMVQTRYTHILMLFALGAFAGLRPGEACNVRRADALPTPGIRFEMFDNQITNVMIDISTKMNLRSDMVDVGGIKRLRMQKVYPAFLDAFWQCFQIYMHWIDGKKYELEYGPLTINGNGKAYTYRAYYLEFQKVVKDCIPVMLHHDDPEVVHYGLMLQEHSISPHILRHWFSTALAQYGEDAAGIMYWRGDRSPESALTYLQNKSDLVKQYASTMNKIFDYEQWKAEKKYGGTNDD